MKPLTRPVAWMLDRVQRRFVRSRSGSILILVVALLMILAFIGAAFITTSRIDRYSAQQHGHNTQIDLLLDGLIEQVKATAVNDLWGSVDTDGDPATPPVRFYRPPSASGLDHDYGHFDFADVRATPPFLPYQVVQHDRWLASRMPSPPPPSGTAYRWASISQPIIGGTFESPWRRVADRGTTYTTRNNVQILWTQNPIGTTTQVGGRVHPALVAAVQGPGGGPVAEVVLAADTDGDGIADAGLVRLPIGEINGLVYYVATRLIDNNSAVNASIAWQNNAPAAPFPGNFWPTNINLRNLLQAGAPGDGDLNRLNNSRFDSDTTNDTNGTAVVNAPSLTPQVDPVTTGGPSSPRADFAFVNQYEAVWNQLGRRLANPGHNLAPPAGRYRSLQVADDLALAYRFILLNPYMGRSSVETALSSALTGNPPNLPPSTSDAWRSRPYAPEQVAEWYFNHFHVDPAAGGDWRAPRSMLVARNPVSNLIPVKNYSGPSLGEPNVPPGALPWSANPRVATKVAIQIASFPALYRGFWSVMSPMGNDAPSSISGAATIYAPQFRNVLRIPAGAVSDPPPPVAPPAPLLPADVLLIRAALAAVNTIDLRDGDDDVTTRQITLSTGQIVRVHGYERQPFITQVYVDNYTGPNEGAPPPGDGDPPPDPGNGTGAGAIDASVQQEEPPPDPGEPGEGTNPMGYVAIELHNPYPVPLVLTNWHLGLIDRRSTPSPGATAPAFTYPLWIRPLGGGEPFTNGPLSDPNSGAPGVLIIPAGGYAILENYAGPAAPGPDPDPDPDPPPDPGNGDSVADGTIEAGVLQDEPPPDPPAPVAFAATYRPPVVEAIIAAGAVPIYVPNLHEVIEGTAVNPGTYPDGTLAPPLSPGGELVLLRPRRADGIYTRRAAEDFRPAIAESLVPAPGAPDPTLPNLYDLVPVDSYDFSNFTIAPLPDPNDPTVVGYRHWHYVRPNGVGTPQHWMFVWPGAYDAEVADGPRHLGTAVSDPFPSNAMQPELGVGVFGGADPLGTYVNDFPPVQLMNVGMPGPNSPWDRSVHPAAPLAPPYAFPFGSFARNGDMLTIPFIGSYGVYGLFDDTGIEMHEMNAVSIDSAYADDQDPGTNAMEHLGRFAPMRDLTLDPPLDDFNPEGTYDPAAVAPAVRWRYQWATRLFDYFAVQTPHDDYLPNAPHNTREYYDPPDADPAPSIYPGPAPSPVANRPGEANIGEELVAVEGLININTAPWYVLAQLPFFPAAPDADVLSYDPVTGIVTAGGNGIPDRIDVAKAIVYFRDVDGRTTTAPAPPIAGGPFRSIFDLNRVENPPGGAGAGLGFRNGWGTLPADPGAVDGDISPLVGGPDGVLDDFESQFLMLNRISNFVTTRSDTFTCYVLVQGWRNVGTSEPELVVQRRAAFILDRTQVTPTNAAPTLYRIPTD